MMKLLQNRSFLALWFIISITAAIKAQTPQQKVDSVFTLVKNCIDQKDAGGIYTLTGQALRKSITQDALHKFVEKELIPLGRIKSWALMSFTNGTAKYRLDFNEEALQLFMSLDETSKIETFLFEPYQALSPQKLQPVASTNPLVTDFDKQLDTLARRYIQKGNTVGLSIGVLQRGETHVYHYGETAKGNGQLPDANTLYEIGSITKTFTATLLAWYVNAGKVKLTDSITHYLPDSVSSNSALRGITLLNLANHTSGLPRLPDNLLTSQTDKLDPYENYTVPLLFSYLKNCKLETSPGQVYDYSNLGAGLLGTILERVSGKPYERMVIDCITHPLHMQNTVLNLRPEQNGHLATVYNQEGGVTPTWHMNALAAAGNLKSSLSDMLLYAKANLDLQNTKLGKALHLVQEVTFNKQQKVALGWHLIRVNGVEYYFHNGGTYGSSSFMVFNPARQTAVVLLSNAAESVDATGAAVAQLCNALQLN
ncbi:beta-lactamase family protein [Mucilaginibacter robiniae]|uniref:Beta-lactamase family protein n=1 Tax=Mucilaginibacter robiniae TaxID=2728022 RepID=A0A7L5E6V6_9SPHI|nr:serine hydrolase domain-containing protein [Mucilaginibacter robiniae]QJD97514.1 beta-lactamase family protein [Mucilaginibacter robiniae]